MVCKITGEYSNRTSEHEERFEGGNLSVYNEMFFGVGGFPVLFSILVVLYKESKYNFETASPLALS